MRTLFLLVPLGACADDNPPAERGGPEPTAPDSGASDAVLEDTGEPLQPAWWVVRAQLAVVDGAGSLQDAAVEVDIVDADLERIACSFALDTSTLTVGVPDDADVAVWWELGVVLPADACATLPGSLGLGIGTLLPDVRARLGSVGYAEVADSLYGAFVRAGDTPLAVYGYAGTTEDRAGAGEAEWPLPDGRYTLDPLYLLALPAR